MTHFKAMLFVPVPKHSQHWRLNLCVIVKGGAVCTLMVGMLCPFSSGPDSTYVSSLRSPSPVITVHGMLPI